MTPDLQTLLDQQPRRTMRLNRWLTRTHTSLRGVLRINKNQVTKVNKMKPEVKLVIVGLNDKGQLIVEARESSVRQLSDCIKEAKPLIRDATTVSRNKVSSWLSSAANAIKTK